MTPRQNVPLSLKRSVLLCGAVVALVGLEGLFSWLAGWPSIFAREANTVSMAPATGLCFAILGLGLFAFVLLPGRYLWLVRIAAILVLGSGLVRLAEYFTGMSWQFSDGVVKFLRQVLSLTPAGRMAFFAAFIFCFAGAALLALSFPGRARWLELTGLALAAGVTVVALLFSLAHLYGSPFARTIPMAVSPTLAFLLFGAGLLLLAVGSDLAQRRQDRETLVHSEQALRQESAILQSVLNSIGDGVIVADEHQHCFLVNPAAERIFGPRLAEIPLVQWPEHYGLFLPDLVTPFPPERLPLLRAICGERVDPVEMYVKGPAASPIGIWLTVSGGPLRNPEGKVKGGVIVCRDLTEHKQSQEQIQQLHAALVRRGGELEAVNKELEAFAYSISHDLRRPVRHVDSFAALLAKEAGNLDETSKQFLDVIGASAREMGRLIDDLLQFSRIGRAELQKQPIELTALLEEAILRLIRETDGRNIVWKKHPLPKVQADPTLLRQVFINLLSNAIKYTRNRDPAELEIGCGPETPEEVVIFVRDNGIGFDMQYADKLFGVFQRLHSAEDFEGTGIGLANVRRIIARHGGRTWAEAKVNAGATFYFSLPKNQTKS